MRENIIRQEFSRRGRNDDDAYKLIGAELKRKRISQSQTLSSIAGDVCSVSYLCKVEKSQIKPNRQMLKEICKKLSIESPKMNLLFQMKEFIVNSAVYYNEGKLEEIKSIYDKCKEFDNYKSQLLSFIYFVAYKNIVKADELALELIKLINVMRDYELNIFILFYSILLVYHESYEEAIDNLNVVLQTERHQIIRLLSQKVIFGCYFKLNMPFTIKYAETLLDIYLYEMNIKEINKIRYYLGLYYAKNKMFDDAIRQLKLIDNLEYKSSLEYIIDLLNCRKSSVNFESLRPFMKLLFFYCNNRKEYRKNYHLIDFKEKLELDFNDNIANYLAINDDEEKFKDLESIYIPNVIKSKNGFDCKYFLSEYCGLSIKFGRYKPFTRACMDLIKEGIY